MSGCLIKVVIWAGLTVDIAYFTFMYFITFSLMFAIPVDISVTLISFIYEIVKWMEWEIADRKSVTNVFTRR